MQKCIELAKFGKPAPNPYVGCVILDKYGNEIVTGYHKKCGENHAERDALLKLQNNEAQGGTLIVNLEPCCHHGKTPPCTDLIIEKGIKRVVIGMLDVNPIVAGNGVKKLREAGIEVIIGVLEDKCKQLNEIFIKNMTKQLPFIAIKTATTLDGKIATSNGSSKWITSENARNEVKNIRNKYDAIMTSSATIIADNPTMEHSTKIILDRELKTDFNAKIYQAGEIFVFYDKNITKHIFDSKIHFIPSPTKDNKLDLQFIFEKSFELGITSILVESGGILNGEALKYADKIYHFIAPKITGDNNSKSCFNFREITNINDCFQLKIAEVVNYEPDILLVYYPIGNTN